MPIFVKKQCFWPFSSKNRSFLGWEKILTPFFLWKLQKRNEKWLYQMKVGIKLVKVKKFWIGWCIPHRVVAENAEGGFVRTTLPPPAWNRVKETSSLTWLCMQTFVISLISMLCHFFCIYLCLWKVCSVTVAEHIAN